MDCIVAMVFLIPLSLTDPALPFPDSPIPLLFFSFFLVHKLPCFSHPLMISWSCLRKQEYFPSLPQTPPLCSSRASEEFFPKVFFFPPSLVYFPVIFFITTPSFAGAYPPLWIDRGWLAAAELLRNQVDSLLLVQQFARKERGCLCSRILVCALVLS